MSALPSVEATARELLAPGKGLLAADESFPTIAKRFKTIGLESTEPNRRAYRDLLFTTPELGRAISGVILFDETLGQKTSSGTLFPAFLSGEGIVPGIKVDGGTVALPGSPTEKLTEGLDGLRPRLEHYREAGARFTKWRAVFSPGPGRPSEACLDANTRALALFASLTQETGLLPLVEPEVLMDGDHPIEACEEAMTRTLRRVFAALAVQRVRLEGMLLKTGMVLSGTDCPNQATDGEIAAATLRCLKRCVPAAVPGIVFLSGGQKDIPATQRLQAICNLGGAPWKLSFSYGRALQDAPLHRWHGNPAHVSAAQMALRRRALCNGLAVEGRYSAAAEKDS